MPFPIILPLLAVGGIAALALSSKKGGSSSPVLPESFGSNNNVMRMSSWGNFLYNRQLVNSAQCSDPANFSPPFAYDMYCKGDPSLFEASARLVSIYFKDFTSPIAQMAHQAVVEAANANPTKLFMEVSHSVGRRQAQLMGGTLVPEVVNNPVYASGGEGGLIVDEIGDKQELVAFLNEEAAKNFPAFGSNPPPLGGGGGDPGGLTW